MRKRNYKLLQMMAKNASWKAQSIVEKTRKYNLNTVFPFNKVYIVKIQILLSKKSTPCKSAPLVFTRVSDSLLTSPSFEKDFVFEEDMYLSASIWSITFICYCVVYWYFVKWLWFLYAWITSFAPSMLTTTSLVGHIHGSSFNIFFKWPKILQILHK